MTKRKNSAGQIRKFGKSKSKIRAFKITKAGWIDAQTTWRNEANAADNMRRIFQVVNYLVKKATPPPHTTQPDTRTKRHPAKIARGGGKHVVWIFK